MAFGLKWTELQAVNNFKDPNCGGPSVVPGSLSEHFQECLLRWDGK